MGRFLIVAAVLLGATHCARAENTMGNKLYELCSASKNDYTKWGLCNGYIVGVFETAAPLVPLCGWDGATNQQLRDIAFQYLYLHPASICTQLREISLPTSWCSAR
jgi:hypothetical protein